MIHGDNRHLPPGAQIKTPDKSKKARRLVVFDLRIFAAITAVYTMVVISPGPNFVLVTRYSLRARNNEFRLPFQDLRLYLSKLSDNRD